jgi:hypothetical protein
LLSRSSARARAFIRWHPAADRGAAATTGSRTNVNRSIVLCSINKGEVRLEDNKIRISDARRANVTGFHARAPSCRGFGIAKFLKEPQLHPRQGCHPVDVG